MCLYTFCFEHLPPSVVFKIHRSNSADISHQKLKHNEKRNNIWRKAGGRFLEYINRISRYNDWKNTSSYPQPYKFSLQAPNAFLRENLQGIPSPPPRHVNSVLLNFRIEKHWVPGKGRGGVSLHGYSFPHCYTGYQNARDFLCIRHWRHWNATVLRLIYTERKRKRNRKFSLIFVVFFSLIISLSLRNCKQAPTQRTDFS